MWRSLGSITPTLTWQLFDIPTFSDTFRVTYGGDIARANTFAYLRQYLSSDIVTKSIRLYPKPQQEVIELSIPSSLRDTGQVLCYLGAMKFPARRFRYQLPDTNWTLTIEEWL
ncbi:MAG: hypothetical protein HC833_21825 [Leptolyngbyaceae cyanobacterium RM1_406_9]|nr:hypothetical protein [Leptolyngbyaceae cyanobacterium RM1_406_9]